MVSAYQHQPVLLAPALDALLNELPTQSPRVFVDGTFGRGGHSRGLLNRLGSTDRLFGIDRDPEAIAAGQQLATEDARFRILSGPFGSLNELLDEQGIEQLDGLLLDIGVSSPQLDDPARGFSFMRDGPLDMRMDTRSGPSAADWLAEAGIDMIREVIARYGEERFALQIAKAIDARRQVRPLRTTGELAELVAGVVRTREKGQHPATRTFQAVRIHINQELEELARALAVSLTRLKPGGRLAVITFHSLEDRLVKQFMAAGRRTPEALARLPLREDQLPQPYWTRTWRVLPDEAEVSANPRARSAVLRVAERSAVAVSAEQARECLPPPLIDTARSAQRRRRA